MSHERVSFSRRWLLVEQIVVVTVLGCGMKVDAMWHVPQGKSCIALCNTWSSWYIALCRVGGATSQLDPLSIASCGRLQLGTPHCAISVNYCK